MEMYAVQCTQITKHVTSVTVLVSSDVQKAGVHQALSCARTDGLRSKWAHILWVHWPAHITDIAKMLL